MSDTTTLGTILLVLFCTALLSLYYMSFNPLAEKLKLQETLEIERQQAIQELLRGDEKSKTNKKVLNDINID